ncbi:MAG: ACP S-malonyltransferase [Terriglobia bacterium]
MSRDTVKDPVEREGARRSDLKRVKGATFVFPGQGAQYVGMGADLSGRFQTVKDTFALAESVLRTRLGVEMPVAKLSFRGPFEELAETTATQVSVFTLSCAILFLLRDHGYRPESVAGHSLGEYTALVAAEVLSFEDAIPVVWKRADLMRAAVRERPGRMAAVLGLPAAEVEEAVRTLAGEGVIAVANYNCPGQVVVSGDADLVTRSAVVFEKLGARRVIPLDVAGAFHSPLMSEAQARFANVLAESSFRDPKIPIVSNVSARPVRDASKLKEQLPEQVGGSVLWEQSIRRLRADGTRLFVECGPGHVLSGLNRKILTDGVVSSVEDRETLEATLKLLEDL